MAFEPTLETDRLILRAWRPEDAKSLFLYASDPQIGPPCGWEVHETPEESERVIREVLSAPEQYAITIKGREPEGGAVGAIGIRLGHDIDGDEETGEVDIGYWIGRPFWGKGYVPEAVRAVIRHAFEDLHVHAVFAGYFEGNDRSMRVLEKVGMFHREREEEPGMYATLAEDHDNPPDPSTGYGDELHMMVLTREEWELAQRADPTAPSYVNAQQHEANEHSKDIPRIAYIRSGAQTGADRGGLDAAREAGIPICGWVPPGGMAEDVEEPPGVLAKYPELTEDTTEGYVSRTALNVRDSHATLIVAPGGLEPKSGTEMTAVFARDYGRPCLVISGTQDIAEVRSWLKDLGKGITLNIAGPRESKLPGVYLETRMIVEELLAEN